MLDMTNELMVVCTTDLLNRADLHADCLQRVGAATPSVADYSNLIFRTISSPAVDPIWVSVVATIVPESS